MTSLPKIYVIGDYNAHFSFEQAGYSVLLDSWYNGSAVTVRTTPYVRSENSIINTTSIKSNLPSLLSSASSENILYFILHTGTTDAKNIIKKHTFFLETDTYVESSLYQSNLESIIQQINVSFPDKKIFVFTPMFNNALYENKEYVNVVSGLSTNVNLKNVVIVDFSTFISSDDFNIENIIFNQTTHFKIFNQLKNLIKKSYPEVKPLSLFQNQEN
jgi:hypothetical protein